MYIVDSSMAKHKHGILILPTSNLQNCNLRNLQSKCSMNDGIPSMQNCKTSSRKTICYDSELQLLEFFDWFVILITDRLLLILSVLAYVSEC